MANSSGRAPSPLSSGQQSLPHVPDFDPVAVVEVTLRGTPVLLASPQDIVRSKYAAGRDKDRRALPILRELVAQQLRAKRAQ